MHVVAFETTHALPEMVRVAHVLRAGRATTLWPQHPVGPPFAGLFHLLIVLPIRLQHEIGDFLHAVRPDDLAGASHEVLFADLASQPRDDELLQIPVVHAALRVPVCRSNLRNVPVFGRNFGHRSGLRGDWLPTGRPHRFSRRVLLHLPGKLPGIAGHDVPAVDREHVALVEPRNRGDLLHRHGSFSSVS